MIVFPNIFLSFIITSFMIITQLLEAMFLLLYLIQFSLFQMSDDKVRLPRVFVLFTSKNLHKQIMCSSTAVGECDYLLQPLIRTLQRWWLKLRSSPIQISVFNSKYTFHIFCKNHFSNCEAQTRIGKGWSLRRKALPRAYTF